MGMNLTLAFESEVPGVPHRNVEAYDLCQGNTMDKLNAIAEQLGITFLDEFPRKPDMSQLPAEQQLALMFGGWDEDEWGPEPILEDLWHDAAKGLATVRAIRHYLSEHPNAIRSGKRELREFEKALESAREHGVRFHVYFDV